MIVSTVCDILERRGDVGPSYEVSDRSFWGLFFGGNESAAGVKITRDAALSDSAFWRGVNLISLDIAKAPMDVFRRRGDGKERDAGHPAYQLLRYRPNEYMTALVFVRTLQAHADVCGFGIAYIERDQEGRPTAMLPLDPECVWPMRERGRLFYRHIKHGVATDIPHMDALVVSGLSWDGIVPMSTIQYAKDALGLSIAAREYGARYFKNGAAPGAVFQLPPGVKMDKPERDRFKEEWAAMHQGIERMHRTAILPMGMTLNPYTANAKDSQLTELRLAQVREMASVLGVPSHKLGDPVRTSYNSLEQEELSYINQTLDGRWRIWEQECRAKLMSEKEQYKDTHLIEFNRNSLVRADIQSRFTAYRTGLETGVMNIDEVRARENMNPLPDGEGQTHLVPLNMTPLKSYTAMLKRLAETGDGEADVEFKRKVLLAMLADATAGDVVYNMTAIDKLLDAVGLVRDKEMGAPALPIVAASGPLVSGEVKKDGEGDIVGGDVEEPEPVPADGLELPSAAGSDELGDGGGKQTGQPGADNPDSANADASDAARAVLSDAYARLSRRVAEQARRESKKGGKRYMRWASEVMAAETRDMAIAALKPGCRVLAIVTKQAHDPAVAVDEWLQSVEKRLLDAADCQEKELVDRVEIAAKSLENSEKEAENE